MKPQLLIVDDESAIRTSLARRYRLKGYEVATAQNGEDALAYLEKNPCHIVISDIKMPKMDGIELLRRIRTEFPMVRVIIMTGYVTLENGLACLRHGADTCIFKPFDDLAELDTAIEQAKEYLAMWEKKLIRLQGMKSDGTAEL